MRFYYRLTKNTLKCMYRLFIIGAAICFFVVKGLYRTIGKIIKLINSFIISQKLGGNPNDIINNLCNLSPRQFEIFCASLYKSMGYKVSLTKETADGGRDIILKMNGKTTFVECKRWRKDNLIGREVCQKLLGSCQMYGADNGIVITTSSFHRNAIECAKSVNSLELVDRDGILDMLMALDFKQIPHIMRFALSH